MKDRGEPTFMRGDEISDQGIADLRTGLVHKLEGYLKSEQPGETEIPELQVFRCFAPKAASARLFEPSLAIILQGRKRIALGNNVYDCDGSRSLLTSIELPVVSQVYEASAQTPFLALLLKLDLETAREIIVDHDLKQQASPTVRPGMETGSVTAELLDAFRRLFDLLSAPKDIPVLSALIQREILYRTLTSEQGARLREIVSAGSRSNRTAEAVTWLRRHYRKPLRVEKLATSVRMGVSTFHRHFRAMTAMSPLQYQKLLRLHEARRLMLTESLDAGSVALEVGYGSATQFNREYRRLFGQPPMRNIRKLRATPEGASYVRA